jgi:hypothetical protein
MATKPKKAEPDIPDFLQRATRRLELDGAIKLSVLGPKSVQAALLAALTTQGFEITKTWVRKPLGAQLAGSLANGAFIPLKSVASHVVGSSGPEAKRAALDLVASGDAKLVLRGTEQVMVPRDASVLSHAQLARFTEIAKMVAKAAKSNLGVSLLREDLAESLVAVLPELSAPASTPTRINGPTHKGSKNGAEGALVARVLSAVAATRDSQTGLSFVPAIVTELRPELTAQAATAILVAAAADGLLELRPEGGINRLSEEELAMCPPGPQGTRLSWARRTEVEQ